MKNELFKKTLKLSDFNRNIKAVEKVIELYKKGYKMDDIAHFSGLSRGTVDNILKANNIEKRKRNNQAKPLIVDISDLCDEMGFEYFKVGDDHE